MGATLKPELILSHNGIPFNHLKEQFTEKSFKEYCDKVIQFVTNSRIKVAFFELGDYNGKDGANRKKEMYNYLDPEAPGADGVPWIVTHFLNRLPQDVEAGAFISTNPKYAWNLYDQNNKDGNTKIGNGKNGSVMDNMAQAFRLIEALNKSSKAVGGEQFVHMEFDHEGGGDYQDDTPYGGKNGDPIGVGYTKWLWNQYMPKSVTFSDKDASKQSFDGHYQWGWINYAVDAWQQKSGGSIDAYAENYWFGENNDQPGKFGAPYTGDKDVPGKWLNLPTIQDVLGKDPGSNLPITGGSNTYNWQVLDKKGNEVLSPQAINTVYTYYKDNPSALVELFDDERYQDNGAKTRTLSSGYYGPISSLDPSNRTGDKAPQAGIPTFSIEYLSSTNGKNASKAKSLIGQYTDNSSLNSNGGTFDGFSVLGYDNWVSFLNGVADRIAKASGSTAEQARIQIYEQQFLPVEWLSESVANPWTDERLGGSDDDEFIDGKNGRDIYTGGGGADTFKTHLGHVTIKDFTPNEGDKLLLLSGVYSRTNKGGDLHLSHESGATASLKNTSDSKLWYYLNGNLNPDFGTWDSGITLHQKKKAISFSSKASMALTRTDARSGIISFGLQSISDGTTALVLKNAAAASASALTSARIFTEQGSGSWLASEGKAQGRSAANSAGISAGNYTPVAIDSSGNRLAVKTLSSSGNTVNVTFAGGISARYSTQATGVATNLPGTGKLSVTVHRLGRLSNGLGFYEADPITGAVTLKGKTYQTGDADYLDAAYQLASQSDLLLNPNQLPKYAGTSTFNNLPLTANKSYGLLLDRGGRGDDLISSFANANPKGTVQTQTFEAPNGGVVYGIEDVRPGESGYDGDFNDFIVSLSSSDFSIA